MRRTLEQKMAALEKQRRRLEQQIEQRRLKFQSLPALIGLKNIDSLIEALFPHGSFRLRRRLLKKEAARVAPTDTADQPRAKGGKGRRYPPQVVRNCMSAMEGGVKTLADISREEGPSVHTLMSWRKSAGISRSRKKQGVRTDTQLSENGADEGRSASTHA